MDHIAAYPEWTENKDIDLTSAGFWSIKDNLILYVPPDKSELYYRSATSPMLRGQIWERFPLNGSLEDVDNFFMSELL